MEIHYDITLKDEGKNNSISYWADSFSVDEHRVLRVQSRDCGNITVQIDPNERLIVRDMVVTDEWDELIENMERQKGENKMGDEDDVVVSNTYCPDACDKRDCDGDWDTYCMKNGHCQYQKNVKDCDGDIISLCRM